MKMTPGSMLTVFKQRSVTLLVVFCIFFVGVTARLAYIQFSWSDELKNKAISQWTREIGVYPKRGTIYDSNGLPLAVSVTRYSLQATPSNIKDAEYVAMLLSPILEMDSDSILAKISDTGSALVWVKRLLSDEQANQVKALAIAGLDLIDEPARVYPYNNLASQVLGFVTKYAESDGHSGQEGIELYYNNELKGEAGTILRESDNTGKEIPLGNEIYVEALDGNNIVLTLDMTLQAYLQDVCEQCLTQYSADGVYAIATNPQTNEILAMVNLPDYDPNEPPRNLSLTDLRALTKNMCCEMNFDPGSVFKTIILSAGLEEGVVTMDDEFYCNGYREIDGVKIGCAWHPTTGGHGAQTTQTGLNSSCNPVFMDIGERLGKDLVYQYIENFGFGQKTGIDISGEESGIMISKENAVHQDWITMCFGQAIAVTPIQMITAFNAIVNGGYLVQPHLLKAITRTVENDDCTQSTEIIYQAEPVVNGQIISQETSATMREALRNVVLNGGGSSASVPGYAIGGKTGTSQTYNTDGTIAEGVDIASFIAFAPTDNPQLSVYFIVSNPKGLSYGSIVAAPYVGQFLAKALPYLGIETTEALVNNVSTPNVVGLELEDAYLALSKKKFDVVIQGSGNIVISQSIEPNTYVSKNTRIVITISQRELSSDMIPVPDLYGLSVLDANKLLLLKGLKLETYGYGQYVIDQSLTAGAFVEAGTTVGVYLSNEYVEPTPSPEITPEPDESFEPTAAPEETPLPSPVPDTTQ